MGEDPAVAAEQEAANLAEVVAVEEREPAPEAGAEREPLRGQDGRFAERDPKPEAEGFNNWEDLQEANSRWAARQEISEKGRDQILSDRVARESYQTALLREQALRAGLIPPSDQMDIKTWAKAFEGKMARGDGAPALPTELEPVAGDQPKAGDQVDQSERGAADREVLDNYRSRVAAFAAGHPGFDEAAETLHSGLAEKVRPAVVVALLEEPQGPEVAYFLGQSPDLVEKLNQLSPTRAVAAIGEYAAQVRQIQTGLDDYGSRYLGVELPPAMVDSYMEKAARLNREQPLSEDEISISRAITPARHVSHAIIAMQRPDLARHLVQNPGLAGRLNAMHPMAAAGKLQSIADELDSESSQQAVRSRLPRPISPTRKTSSTDSALRDDLPNDEWAVRFKRKMKYE